MDVESLKSAWKDQKINAPEPKRPGKHIRTLHERLRLRLYVLLTLNIGVIPLIGYSMMYLEVPLWLTILFIVILLFESAMKLVELVRLNQSHLPSMTTADALRFTIAMRRRAMINTAIGFGLTVPALILFLIIISDRSDGAALVCGGITGAVIGTMVGYRIIANHLKLLDKLRRSLED